MAKLIYRNDDYPTIDLEADSGEEVATEQVMAWALFRLGYSIESVGIGLQAIANELPVQ